jgi:hypothetical protein
MHNNAIIITFEGGKEMLRQYSQYRVEKINAPSNKRPPRLDAPKVGLKKWTPRAFIRGNTVHKKYKNVL